MEDAWKVFEQSGRVTDYLAYCQQKTQIVANDNRVQDMTACAGVQTGGLCGTADYGDRNSTFGNQYK